MSEQNMGEKLRTNQVKAIEALAAGATNEVAAAEANVQVRTLFNWKCQPNFKQALQDATDRALQETSQALTFAAKDAVLFLQNVVNNTDAKDSTRVQAAKVILDSVLRLREQYELTRRIELIEGRLHELKSSP